MTGRCDKAPLWFKLWGHHRTIVESVPDEVVGRAFKAALRYFTSGEVTKLEQLDGLLFAALKADADDAFEEYRRNVENGRKGGRPKGNAEEKPLVKGGDPPSPPLIQEKRGEKEEKRREKEGVCSVAKPPQPRFSPPSVEDVRAYCTEQGYHIDPERFVDYYSVNGWMAGKNKMKDWKAAVRNWNRKDHRNASKIELEQFCSPNWTIV